MKNEQRQYLYNLLDKACDRCEEGQFVASHFVSVCMEEQANIRNNTIEEIKSLIKSKLTSGWHPNNMNIVLDILNDMKKTWYI